MYKKTLLLIVLFSCLFISCRSKRQETTTITNTEYIKEIQTKYRDTTLYAPKAETTLKIPINDIEFKPSLNSKPKIYTQKNAQAKLEVQVKEDIIEVTATCDSVALKAKIRSELEKEFAKNTTVKDAKKDTKTGFTFFQILLAFLFGFVVCFILKTLKIV